MHGYGSYSDLLYTVKQITAMYMSATKCMHIVCHFLFLCYIYIYLLYFYRHKIVRSEANAINLTIMSVLHRPTIFRSKTTA